MDEKTLRLIDNWKQRNIEGLYFKERKSAIDKISEVIPLSATVGFSGSVTLDELGIIKILESRGNKVFNQYKSQISREESLEMRRQGAQADYFLSSANAVSQSGELVFLSAYGFRTAGIANARNVIIVCGINKLTPNLEEAIKRAREYAMPLNYKRLNWEPSKRMCCQTLIIEAEVVLGRLKVILVGENLGF
jgi:L-lactate utilization protein LutB